MTDALKEAAERLARKIYDLTICNWDQFEPMKREAEHICQQALISARNEALEEAAQMVENKYESCGDELQIADSIRALIEKEKP